MNAFTQQHASLAQRLTEQNPKFDSQALVEFDAETRFKIRQQRGANQLEHGLALLRVAQGLPA
jgi:hypothetical protein